MRYALIADIHGNIEAFEAVLAHAQASGAERILLLGDMVGYGADPKAVLDRCMALLASGEAVAVLGNHDAVACQRMPCPMNEEAQVAIEWTQARLKPRHVDFLRRLPLTYSEGPLFCVHASAWQPEQWHYIVSGRDAEQSLGCAADAGWVFCGHVHVPALFYTGRDGGMFAFRPADDTPVLVATERRWLTVVGSCGQPRDGLAGARYLLFDRETQRQRFMRVPYDWCQAAAKIKAAGLPARLAMYLAGRP